MNNRAAGGEIRLPGVGRTFLAVVIHPGLLPRALRCVLIIWKKFFFFQYRSALFPRLPVSRAEHKLDDCIPFNPSFIRIYLDFTHFWIRIVGFLCINFGKQGRTLAAGFIESITGLYHFAFQIYQKNLSTTARPNYKKGFHFRLIHLVDPHLMCIPSLHVMLMIHSYTAFRRSIRALGTEETFRELDQKIFSGALTITEAVLYVKQHSINCVAAAMYAMACYDPPIFSNADAEAFAYRLFGNKAPGDVPAEYVPFYRGALVGNGDTAWLREHIISLYYSLMEEKSDDWTKPLLELLATLDQAES